MLTNPYKPPINQESLDSYTASSISGRIPAFICVGSVLISMPLFALWAISIINSLIVSNMAIWEIILLFFSIVTAIPIGFVSLMIGRIACRGRWPLEIVITAVLLIGAFPLSYKLTAGVALRKSSSLLVLYGSLIGSIAIGPMLIGILLYSILRRTLFPYRKMDLKEA